MEYNTNYWHVGEIVKLPRTETPLTRNGNTSYDWIVGSRYIVIREATDSQRGILAKVLGQFTPKYIIIVDGQPFSKNDKDDLIDGARFFSYPFPAAKDVKEALDILRNNPSLLQKFEEASMHIDIQSKFWVSETASHLIIMKKPQCYDAYSGSVITASDNNAPYRLTLAYFYKGELTW